MKTFLIIIETRDGVVCKRIRENKSKKKALQDYKDRQEQLQTGIKVLAIRELKPGYGFYL